MLRFILVVVVIACGAAVPLHAATLSFQQGVAPTAGYAHLGQDFRGNGSTNTGADTLVGMQVGGVLQLRTALAFDLSAIPAGSVITDVTLRMTVNNTGFGTVSGLGAIEVHEAIPNGNPANNMAENQVTFTNWATASPWTTTGGDLGPTLTTAGVTDGNANNTFENGEFAAFPSSAAFASAAQNAYAAGLPLELILISPTAEAAASSHFARFGSDDAVTAANRPLLTVTYTPVPEPAAGLLALAAVAGLFTRRRAS